MTSHLRLRGPQVLVIDDDPILIDVVRRLLTRAGLDVVTAASAAEARARTERFSVGVFDIELGSDCGVDLAEQMLATGWVAGAVFYTGGASEAKLARAARLGPVVSKGEHPNRLVQEVADLVARVHSKRTSETG
jgi:CheY-like chemotaxis protein